MEQIYNPSLVLEKTNSNFHYDTFLDLDIRVNFDKFVIGIFHKIDDFSFNVICYYFNVIYPTIDNNISSLFEESLSNKLTKFCDVCFVDSVHEENLDISQPQKFLMIHY